LHRSSRTNGTVTKVDWRISKIGRGQLLADIEPALAFQRPPSGQASASRSCHPTSSRSIMLTDASSRTRPSWIHASTVSRRRFGLQDVDAADVDHLRHVEMPGMTTRARGTFDVKLTPQPADADADATTLGRMSIDKQFRGDLEGTSKGQMLTGMTAVTGSAGYVAIERVTGTLQGRRGTFVLQHTGTMTRGAQDCPSPSCPTQYR
jgi:hypothetical protein